jgi:four helix bundle protein
MKSQAPNSKQYNLEERTAKFAELVIDLVKKLPQNSINKRLIEQCVASAGSIGANYCEANESESKRDFLHKIGICKKEAKETKHWLRLLAYANRDFKEDFKELEKEAQEIVLIFSSIIKSAKRKPHLNV